MADEWDDDYTPAAKPISQANTKKYASNDGWDDNPAPAKSNNQGSNAKQNDGWDDEPKPAARSNTNGGWSGNNGKKADDGWNDDPKPASNGWNGNAKKSNNDDGWDDEPASTSYTNTSKGNGKRSCDWDAEPPKSKFGRNDGWSGGNNDGGWGNDSGDKKPFASRSNNDRGPRKPDWICTNCSKTCFGSRDACFSCNEPKGDAKDAPPGSDGGRPKRANDWICSQCSAKVFGSKTTCFKCQADKGDSQDAPADDGGNSSWGGGGGGGRSGGGRANDWICSQCSAKVFGSKSTCFKCQADKGDSKDAPKDDEGSFGGGGGSDAKKGPGGRPGDWTCSCGVSNYASRNECFKCQEAKPEGAGGEAQFNGEAPKEFYIPSEVAEDDLFNCGISSGINFANYKNIPVKVTDESRNNIPKACLSFKESGLNDFLISNIEKSNYKSPTPIQQNSIPIISAGRDLMACAQTGSGKTAAFLLPIINKLMNENAPVQIARPYVVIVTPTRELCTQIYNEARKFSAGSIIKCCQIYGGTASRHQNSNLNSGCHILVATPGRLKDFADKTFITFENLRYFILDEADRMLDMGFAPAVEEIMRNPTMVPTGKRQTLMFSATFPNDIQRLAGKYLSEYIFLTIGIIGAACADVTQTIHQVTKFEKRTKLMELLDAEDPIGTMVFVETKRTADFLASFLSESKHPTTSIHGDRKQSQREEALADFKSQKMKVIIATSVAARGLDIKNVRHVINYDLPKSIDDYVHRIGRTGRVGNTGKSTSFFDAEQDSEIINDLIRVLQDSKQQVPEFLGSGASGGGSGGGGDGFGGTDFRSKSSANKTSAPPAHGGDDEEW